MLDAPVAIRQPLSVWFYHSLRTEGLPAICIDARHAKAALDMAANKTDANDADGLAQLAEVGFFREVRVKGFNSMLTRTLVAARTRLVRITTELSNQIRGVMKTFGLLVPAGKGSTFEKNVRSLLADQDGLASIVLPMLEPWRGIRITWGLQLRQRIGFKRAAVAVARKLAVIMHTMPKNRRAV
jgi:transposase